MKIEKGGFMAHRKKTWKVNYMIMTVKLDNHKF